jgi:hypothetical protein
MHQYMFLYPDQTQEVVSFREGNHCGDYEIALMRHKLEEQSFDRSITHDVETLVVLIPSKFAVIS